MKKSSSDDLIPPSPSFGVHDFKVIGERWVGFLIKFAGLQPNESVLDVGCGGGRMAIPLTRHLSREGSYEGFDVLPEWIRYCSEKITPRFPNFRFQVADIYNGQFNPTGLLDATEYVFPYPDQHFDVVLLVSVFTHMTSDAMKHYLSEIARVLKPGGRSLISFFLLNEESLRLLEEQRSRRYDPAPTSTEARFSHDFGHYRTTSPTVPESLVAYKEEFIRDLYGSFGLAIAEPIYYGGWPGRKTGGRKAGLAAQDFIVARKSSPDVSRSEVDGLP